MKVFATLLICCLFYAAKLPAQGRVITGRVVDSTDNPLSNVSIVIQGARKTGTSTRTDGTFTLTVPSSGTTLEISSIGFVSRQVRVGDQTNFDIRLATVQTAQSNLSEVVVVAYGTARKSTYTGSAVQIDSKSIEQRPLTNVIGALTGAAPGIQASSGSGQPGSGPNIRIRGFGSVNASNDPLYVVDGVPYSGNVANINPDDIQTLSVLKDASASALYGSRAANGVIMITTKRGRKGQNQLQINVNQGSVSRGLSEYDRVDAYQYYPLMWEAYRNSLVYGTSPVPIATASQTATNNIKNLLGYNPFNVKSNDIVRTDGTLNPSARLLYPDDLDWEKPIQRNGNRSDYSMSVNGGSDKSDYYISLGYVNEKGFAIKSDYERFNGRINLNTQPVSWFKTGLNISGNITKSNQANTGSSTGYINPFNFSRNIGPIYPVYAHDTSSGTYLLDPTGNKIYDLGNMTSLGLPTRPSNGSPGRHIVAETEYNNNLFKRNVLSGRTYGEITFLKNFKFTSNISIDISNYLGSTYDNKIVGDGAPAGRASRTSTTTTSYTFNQLLNYNKSFGSNQNLEILAGHENYDLTYNYFYATVSGQIVDGNTELGNFTTSNAVPNSRTDHHRIESYLSRINYSIGNKYFASASFRRDGSSKFAKEARWGNFWSVAAGWRLDQESFMSTIPWINMLKLRSSYGLVGNDVLLDVNGNEDYYPAQALYSLGYNNASEPGFVQANLANTQLLWETNKQFDIGIDFGFLQNRVSGSLEFFHRQSDNLLFNVPLPVSSGTLNINKNIGTMYNRGIELQVGVDIIRNRAFSWNINANATTFANKITKLPQPEIISGTKKLMVGHSLYDYWLRDWYGVDPADGAALYVQNAYNASNSRVSKTGDSVTTAYTNAKLHYAGSAIPDVYGGVTNTFTFHNFDLSFQITYQLGGKVYDATYAGLMSAGGYGGAFSTDILRRWQKAGDVTDVPRMDATTATITTFGAQSDRWLVSASYLNFRTINLGYNLPADVISRIKVQRARFYLSGENLTLNARRKGMNVTQAFTGVTSNVYVPARVLSAGLNITL